MRLIKVYPHSLRVFLLCQDASAERFSWPVPPEWSPCYGLPLPKGEQIKALSEESGPEFLDQFRNKLVGKGVLPFFNKSCVTTNISDL